MRYLSIIWLLLICASAQAETKLLSCTTAGDAVGEVILIESKQGNRIDIHNLNDTVNRYRVKRGYRHIKANDSDTFVGIGPKSIEFGGAVSDAILLRVFKGNKEARLGVNGMVMFLKCRK